MNAKIINYDARRNLCVNLFTWSIAPYKIEKATRTTDFDPYSEKIEHSTGNYSRKKKKGYTNRLESTELLICVGFKIPTSIAIFSTLKTRIVLKK